MVDTWYKVAPKWVMEGASIVVSPLQDSDYSRRGRLGGEESDTSFIKLPSWETLVSMVFFGVLVAGPSLLPFWAGGFRLLRKALGLMVPGVGTVAGPEEYGTWLWGTLFPVVTVDGTGFWLAGMGLWLTSEPKLGRNMGAEEGGGRGGGKGMVPPLLVARNPMPLIAGLACRKLLTSGPLISSRCACLQEETENGTRKSSTRTVALALVLVGEVSMP